MEEILNFQNIADILQYIIINIIHKIPNDFLQQSYYNNILIVYKDLKTQRL